MCNHCAHLCITEESHRHRGLVVRPAISQQRFHSGRLRHNTRVDRDGRFNTGSSMLCVLGWLQISGRALARHLPVAARHQHRPRHRGPH